MEGWYPGKFIRSHLSPSLSLLAEPAYNRVMVNQLFTWEELQRLTHRSAYDAIMVASFLGLTPLPQWLWRYSTFSLADLDRDGWLSTLSKYGGLRPEEMRHAVLEGRVPSSDIKALVARPELLSPEELAERLAKDVNRLQTLEGEIRATGIYYPPILGPSPKRESLDGAHRLAALYHLYGPDFKVYTWMAEKP